MKKFVCFLLLFLLVGVIGCEPHHYLIVGIQLTPVARQEMVNAYGETIHPYRPVAEFTDEITFHVSGNLEEQIMADKINLNTSSQCYAFSPGRVSDNRLLECTYSMTLDRPFAYAENIIKASTNILQEQAFSNEIIIEGIIDGYYGSIVWIKFNETFSENAIFEDDYYNVTFSCKTSDGLFLQSGATVKFPTKASPEEDDV